MYGFVFPGVLEPHLRVDDLMSVDISDTRWVLPGSLRTGKSCLGVVARSRTLEALWHSVSRAGCLHWSRSVKEPESGRYSSAAGLVRCKEWLPVLIAKREL